VNRLIPAVLLMISLAGQTRGDSIFDFRGTGKDVIPVAGASRALGGAVAASDDPLSAAVMNPFASAHAERVIVTIGAAHTGTNTNNFGEEKRTASTLFPTIGLTVPLFRISFMSGLFLERAGRLSLAETDTAYVDEIYDARYRKEVSFFSVPIYVSADVYGRVIVAGGVLYSAYDSKWTDVIDFRSGNQSDTEDVSEISANGTSFAGGLLVDLDRVRIAGLVRGGTDMDGTLERENKRAGVWSREDVTLSSEHSFKIGLWASPVAPLSIEVDYDRSPWSNLKIDGRSITHKRVERWAVGIEYRGDHLWKASKYPLCLGYYKQPLDWQTDLTGEITEQVFCVGTSLRMGGDRAAISIALEFGQRNAKHRSDLSENTFAFALSLSAMEVWKREIRR
jgi:hypothetical protein